MFSLWSQVWLISKEQLNSLPEANWYMNVTLWWLSDKHVNSSQHSLFSNLQDKLLQTCTPGLLHALAIVDVRYVAFPASISSSPGTHAIIPLEASPLPHSQHRWSSDRVDTTPYLGMVMWLMPGQSGPPICMTTWQTHNPSETPWDWNSVPGHISFRILR